MSFFEHQDRARQNTQQLIGLFALSIGCIITTVYGAALITFGGLKRASLHGLWHPGLFAVIAVGTLFVVGCGSWYKLLQLRQGGRVIAQDLGGRLLIAETANEAERQLLNVVEEMAIAATIPVPAVYVLDREQGINAFAAGYAPKDAVIGVTRGLLEQLNREELQGVIGHEFSHILNGDMRLNLRLVGLLHGILLIYLIGRILVRWNVDIPSRKDKENSFFWFGLALVAIGSIGMVCGQLIQCAVSRQREFLADASAVQFTRNPAGIAGALEKIAAYHSGSLIQSAHAASNSHLFFGNALRFNFFGDLLATHPPLGQRIKRLSAYMGRYSSQPEIRSESSSQLSSNQLPSSLPSNQAAVMGFAGAAAAQTLSPRSSTAAPRQAQNWLMQIPQSLQTGLQTQQGAEAIVYALALDLEDQALQQQQVDWLKQSNQDLEAILAYSQALQQIDARLRLPLLDQCLPLLRQSPAAQCHQMLKNTNALAKLDGRWSIDEFALCLILWHHLLPCIQPVAEQLPEHKTLQPVWSDCLMLLSALARVGQTQPEAVSDAFRAGLYRLPGAGQFERPDAPPACNLNQLRKSLEQLKQVSPRLKQAIVDACAHLVLLDGSVGQQEATLLWAIATVLNCSLPPFLLPKSA